MMDPELKRQLDQINVTLIQINKKTANVWRSFLHGTMSGLGSIFGVAIALIIIGYILNALGVIPALRNQVGEWQRILDNLTKIR
jgi:hypothetical protein